MQPTSPYSLVHEMLETPGLLRRFDERQAADWAAAIDRKGKLFLTGEGASRIFPANNLIDQAGRRGKGWTIRTEGARQAAEYPLQDYFVLGASNSGRTRELITLVEKLKKENIPVHGVTATPGSRLTELCDCKVLTCGAEKAVAATKSFVEQALLYQALLQGDEWKNKEAAAAAADEILKRHLPGDMVGALAAAPMVYFAGRNNGVAEQLTLMANEVVRQKSAYLEGTYVLHGVEEVMREDEVVVLVDPFAEELTQYQNLAAADITIIAISISETPFPTIQIPHVEGFGAFLQLMAGWNLLVSAGLAKGVDLDKTQRARKIGNEIPGAGQV